MHQARFAEFQCAGDLRVILIGIGIGSRKEFHCDTDTDPEKTGISMNSINRLVSHTVAELQCAGDLRR